MKLGSWRTVFAASPEAVKEVLIKKSAEYAGRPMFESLRMFSLGKFSFLLPKIFSENI